MGLTYEWSRRSRPARACLRVRLIRIKRADPGSGSYRTDGEVRRDRVLARQRLALRDRRYAGAVVPGAVDRAFDDPDLSSWHPRLADRMEKG